MRRTALGALNDYDPEPERTFHQRRRHQRAAKILEMAGIQNNNQVVADLQNNQQVNPAAMTLGDYVMPSHPGPVSGVVRPPVVARNFELKPSLINMVQQNQFGGLPSENPHLHLNTFIELMDTVKIHDVSQDALFLRAFSFSLRDRAKAWFKALPQGSVKNWEELTKAFLNKFFPPKKTAEMRNQILTFQMKDGESLYEGWERFKELMMLCPHHGQQKWSLLHVFYNAVDSSMRLIIDAYAGGRIMSMGVDDAWDLIEATAQHQHYYNDARASPSLKKQAGIYEVDAVAHAQAQMSAMAQEIKRLSLEVQKVQSQPAGTSTQNIASVICQFCGDGSHTISSCHHFASQNDSEEVNYMNNFNRGARNERNEPYSNSYNPGWRNHPNFSYANNQAALRPPPGFQQQPQQSQNHSPVSSSEGSKFDLILKELQNIQKTLKDHDSHIADLNLRVPRPHGQLPGQSEANPKGQVNDVSLRNGRQLEDLSVMHPKEKTKVVEEPEIVVE